MSDLNRYTEALLRDAGIAPGMRVIDVGCGHGKVTALVAKLVGPTGSVLALDRDAEAIAIAKRGAADLGHANVEFRQVDLPTELPEAGEFDAVVGRRVLMYLPDPAAAIRGLCAALRPGGLVVFQETDSTMVPTRLSPLPLHDQVLDWIWTTVEREGANLNMGFTLPAVFAAAGVALAQLRMEPAIQGQATHQPLAMIVRAITPRITKHGVATEAEIDIDTLERRLAAELPPDVVYVSDVACGAWGHKMA